MPLFFFFYFCVADLFMEELVSFFIGDASFLGNQPSPKPSSPTPNPIALPSGSSSAPPTPYSSSRPIDRDQAEAPPLPLSPSPQTTPAPTVIGGVAGAVSTDNWNTTPSVSPPSSLRRRRNSYSASSTSSSSSSTDQSQDSRTIKLRVRKHGGLTPNETSEKSDDSPLNSPNAAALRREGINLVLSHKNKIISFGEKLFFFF